MIAQSLQRDGFGVTSSSILSEGVVEALKLKMPDLFRGEFETGVYPDEWHWRQGLSRDDVTREICNGWKSDRLVASVVLSQTIGEMVSRITGWSSVRIAQDDVIWKPPSQPRTTIGFHQDSAYISDQFLPQENNSVTVWMALDDVTEDMGCLEYAVGSHLCPNQASSLDETTFHDCNESSYRSSIPSDAEVRFVPVCRGHAVVHHQSVWHGSGPNLSQCNDRRALVGHYLRGDVKFKDEGGAAPWGSTSYIYGKYKRYNSVEVDESFFPVIYATESSGKSRTQWIDNYVGFD